jgi:hypothetical protein
MAHVRVGTDKSRSLAMAKKVLSDKHAGKKKSELTDADVAEYVKTLMVNDLGIEDDS